MVKTKKFIDSSENTISKYLKDVRKSTLLTPEDELSLAKRIRESNDQEAKDELCLSNLRFVISIAKEYQNQGIPLSDLINEGNYGLLKAAERFDHTKGFRFISYAVWWIRQSILQSLNETSRTVRLPVNITNQISMVKKQITKMEQQFGRDINYSDIDMTILQQPSCTSFNTPINEEGDELVELLSDNNLSLPGDNFLNDEILKSEMDKTLGVLSERERKIIEMYFGMDGQPMTLEQIGDEYGLTKERVRQIKQRSLQKLRSNSYNLTEFLYK